MRRRRSRICPTLSRWIKDGAHILHNQSAGSTLSNNSVPSEHLTSIKLRKPLASLMLLNFTVQAAVDVSASSIPNMQLYSLCTRRKDCVQR